MNNSDKQQLAKLYAGMALTYGRTVTAESVAIMVNSLDDLDFNDVRNVLNEWVATETQFPMPSLIRNKIKPKIDELDDGREIASRCIGAVAKFGWPSPEGARSYIGEVGWECVQRFGGWRTFCQELSYENQNMMMAQIRDLAQTIMKRSKAGILNKTISLPQPSKASSEMHTIGDIAKNLLKGSV